MSALMNPLFVAMPSVWAHDVWESDVFPSCMYVGNALTS